MSFDLVLRRARRFTLSEAQTAFKRSCGGDVELDGRTIRGRGFELEVGDDDGELYVRCAWSFAGDAEAQQPIRKAARMLGARVVDPQVEPLDEPAAATPISVGSGVWGRPWDGALPTGASTLRGMSLATVPPTQHPALDLIHAMFVRALGEGISPKHTFHPERLAELVCTYAMIPAGVMPFDLIVARSHARASGGVTSGQRLFAVVDGSAGWLTSSEATLGRENDGTYVSVWKSLVLRPVGTGRNRLGSELDVTERVVSSAIRALRRANQGDTAPLRAWLCTMASIDRNGRACEELAEDSLVVEPAMATMRVWAMNLFAPQIQEVQLDVYGAFRVRIVDTGLVAVRRDDLPSPVNAEWSPRCEWPS